MNLANEIIKKLDALRSVSNVTNRIMELTTDPDGSLLELAEIVRYDQALTVNLLRMCNSAYYGFPVPVDSVDHAVNLLGMNKTVELALIGSFGQCMANAQKGYGLRKGELWTSSVASALLSKSFAEKRYPNLDKFLIYTASLIKDIGKIVIDEYVGKALKKIMYLVNKKKYSFDEAETEVLGIDHAELGGLIAEKWNFNPKMVFLIRNHHLNRPNATADREASIIHIVDIVSRMMNVGIGADGLAYRVYDEMFSHLVLSETDVKELMTQFKLHLNIAEQLFHDLR